MKRKCRYRHCNNKVPGKFDRPDQIYCCRNHKDMEYTYLKREKEKNNYKLLVDITKKEAKKLRKIRNEYT